MGLWRRFENCIGSPNWSHEHRINASCCNFRQICIAFTTEVGFQNPSVCTMLDLHMTLLHDYAHYRNKHASNNLEGQCPSSEGKEGPRSMSDIIEKMEVVSFQADLMLNSTCGIYRGSS